MSIALIVTDRSVDLLVQCLKQLKPDLDIQVWPNIQHPQDVEFAVLWKQPKGVLKTFPNLKAVTSLGAGIDFIVSDSDLPKNIPVYRIVTDDLKQQMAQYVLAYILHDFRQLKQYKQQQQIHLWQIYEPQKNPTVGFLGLGKIGEFVAQQCINLGFKTLAFTHQSKHKDIDCYHNEEGLKKVMSESNYLVCLLPLTPDTAGILNMKRFYYCKKHPLLIHVGRGEQLIEKDLFMALDKELIRQAVLDVFAIEPLPDGHIFWQRDDIIITPHNAARSDVQQTAEEIISLVNL